MTQLETLQDIYERLAEIKEVICDYCDYCRLTIVERPQLSYGTDNLISTVSYLATSPNVSFVDAVNESLDLLVFWLNQRADPQFRLKAFTFYQRLIPPLNFLAKARDESTLLAFLTAVQALGQFVFSNSGTCNPQKVRELLPEKGNQQVELEPEEKYVRVEVMYYPPSFGRFFTGFDSPISFVIPNSFWLFFWSDQLEAVIAFEQIRYLHQVFSIPSLASRLFVQVPSIAKLKLEFYAC